MNSKEELQYIAENAGLLTDKQMAASLGKSIAAVRKARQRLGIAKMNGRGRCIIRSRMPVEEQIDQIT